VPFVFYGRGSWQHTYMRTTDPSSCSNCTRSVLHNIIILYCMGTTQQYNGHFATTDYNNILYIYIYHTRAHTSVVHNIIIIIIYITTTTIIIVYYIKYRRATMVVIRAKWFYFFRRFIAVRASAPAYLRMRDSTGHADIYAAYILYVHVYIYIATTTGSFQQMLTLYAHNNVYAYLQYVYIPYRASCVYLYSI